MWLGLAMLMGHVTLLFLFAGPCVCCRCARLLDAVVIFIYSLTILVWIYRIFELYLCVLVAFLVLVVDLVACSSALIVNI